MKALGAFCQSCLRDTHPSCGGFLLPSWSGRGVGALLAVPAPVLGCRAGAEQCCLCSTPEEEINNMKRELEKYGLQLPAFSKIGGILANELSVDEAAGDGCLVGNGDGCQPLAGSWLSP